MCVRLRGGYAPGEEAAAAGGAAGRAEPGRQPPAPVPPPARGLGPRGPAIAPTFPQGCAGWGVGAAVGACLQQRAPALPRGVCVWGGCRGACARSRWGTAPFLSPPARARGAVSSRGRFLREGGGEGSAVAHPGPAAEAGGVAWPHVTLRGGATAILCCWG